ncbi:unnamed protein product [Diatraea saccharalis]|uniref:Metallothionein n=1 Tax=Diatraea saccharalis TaxID=40085 RepID=A0A9N9N3K5_9NEOP|nr:unnamed protein product [Diatraea saccharalis]
MKAVISLYNALVRSQLEHKAIVWAPYEKKYTLMLERVQNKFARVPDRYIWRRRQVPLLMVPSARTNLLKEAPFTRAISIINMIANEIDIFDCALNCKCTATQCCDNCKCDSSCNCDAKKTTCSGGDSCSATKK